MTRCPDCNILYTGSVLCPNCGSYYAAEASKFTVVIDPPPEQFFKHQRVIAAAKMLKTINDFLFSPVQ